jgi:CBS domain-containing protein
MTTVKHILDQKGHDVHCIHPDASVFDARDCFKSQDVTRNSGPGHYVDMSTKPTCARPDQSVEECMAVMTAKAVRHLPVIEGGRLVGIISIGDMVKSVIGDQKFIIEQLEHFIHGDR